jgi:large subunit ribosomal protein L19
MKTESIKEIENVYVLKPLSFSVGDTIAVKSIIREGDKKRTQIFKGIVIAIKRSGIRKTFTVRKISSGIGVEKILPLNSPNIESIKVLRKGAVRKSKLYYMRKRIGKKALKIDELVSLDEEKEDVINEEETKSVETKVTDEKSK